MSREPGRRIREHVVLAQTVDELTSCVHSNFARTGVRARATVLCFSAALAIVPIARLIVLSTELLKTHPDYFQSVTVSEGEHGHEGPQPLELSFSRAAIGTGGADCCDRGR
jgi:hypothetical protein